MEEVTSKPAIVRELKEENENLVVIGDQLDILIRELSVKLESKQIELSGILYWRRDWVSKNQDPQRYNNMANAVRRELRALGTKYNALINAKYVLTEIGATNVCKMLELRRNTEKKHDSE